MPILASDNNMAAAPPPSFRDFKKQASFFFKEKIKNARLALTDVTPAQLMTEEITAGNQRAPDTPTMKLITKAAFEVDDYWRVVDILHKRFSKFDPGNWRVSYNSLILLENLMTHGPASAAEEFQTDRDVILAMQTFQYKDDKGFDWGLAVRKKSERVLSLLGKGPLLKQERDQARKLAREIHGFGSFSNQKTWTHGIMLEHSPSFGALGTTNDLSKDLENKISYFREDDQEPQQKPGKTEGTYSFRQGHLCGIWEAGTYQEDYNRASSSDVGSAINSKQVNSTRESKPLLEEHKGKQKLHEETGILVASEDHNHPFDQVEEAQAFASLLSTQY